MAAGAGRSRALTRLFAIGGATGSASVVAPFLKWKLRLNRETTLAAHPASAAGAVGTDVTQIIEYTVGGPTFGDQTEVGVCDSKVFKPPDAAPSNPRTPR